MDWVIPLRKVLITQWVTKVLQGLGGFPLNISLRKSSWRFGRDPLFKANGHLPGGLGNSFPGWGLVHLFFPTWAKLLLPWGAPREVKSRGWELFTPKGAHSGKGVPPKSRRLRVPGKRNPPEFGWALKQPHFAA